ncbi:hypothetical protein QUA30_23805 [Microcoleus sp. Pol14C2]|uniref:hypothetical protein n=1 Tax=unclassified Microcoleus TaxID=2642155 RepID=UPI002FD18A7B
MDCRQITTICSGWHEYRSRLSSLQKNAGHTAGDELLLRFHTIISQLKEVTRAIAPVKIFEEKAAEMAARSQIPTFQAIPSTSKVILSIPTT